MALLHQLLKQWLPGRCFACEQSTPPGTSHLCSLCYADLPWCEALPNRLRQNLPDAAHIIAPVYFQGAVRDWIHQLKYRGGRTEGEMLGSLLAAAVAAYYLPSAAEHSSSQPGLRPPSAIVPVPMPWRSWLKRGRNPATAIAQPVARRLGLPILESLVHCGSKAREQHNLGQAERAEAMRGLFSVRAMPPASVAIVDDVATTGATCRALCDALRDAGCNEVHVWCAAYTPLPTACN